MAGVGLARVLSRCRQYQPNRSSIDEAGSLWSCRLPKGLEGVKDLMVSSILVQRLGLGEVMCLPKFERPSPSA